MKKKKIIICLLIIQIITLTLMSCSPTAINELQDDEAILYWRTASRPRVLVPAIDLSEIEKQIVNQMYEGLTTTEGDDVYNALASDIEFTNNEKTINITIRNANWSDGHPVTANDFKYSWERQDNYVDDINLLYFDTGIESVEVINDFNLKINMQYRNDDILKDLSTIPFMPMREDIVDLDSEMPAFTAEVTNGPFELLDYNFSNGVKLIKNEAYHRSHLVRLSEIHMLFTSDNYKAYTDFKDGRLDVMSSVALDQYEKLLLNDPEFHLLNKLGVYSYSINPENKALADVHVRSLLNLAIDRSEIDPYKSFFNDSVAYSIVKDYHREADDDFLEHIIQSDKTQQEKVYRPSTPYIDSEEINELLPLVSDDARDALNNLQIITSNNSNDIYLAQLLSDSWYEYLGFRAEIVPKDRYDFLQVRDNKSYDIILDPYYYRDEHPRHMLKFFLSRGKINHSCFREDSFDEILEKFLLLEDSYLNDYFDRAIEIIENSGLFIPIFDTYEPVLVKERVQGWTRSYESLFNFGKAYKTKNENR